MGRSGARSDRTSDAPGSRGRSGAADYGRGGANGNGRADARANQAGQAGYPGGYDRQPGGHRGRSGGSRNGASGNGYPAGYGPPPAASNGNGRAPGNGYHRGNGYGGQPAGYEAAPQNRYGRGNGRQAGPGYDARGGDGYPPGQGGRSGRGAGSGGSGRGRRGYGPGGPAPGGPGYDDGYGGRSGGGWRRGGGRSGGPPAGPPGGPAGGPGGPGFPGGRGGADGWRARNAQSRAGGQRFDIKARLGAITGTSPAIGRGLRGRAAGRPGQGYLDDADSRAGYDSFEDIAGYRPAARTRATALRDRVEAARLAGTARLQGRRPGGPGGGPGGPGGWNGGRRPRKPKGNWWRHWTLKKALAVFCASVAGLVLLLIAGVMIAYAQTQIPTDVSEAALAQSSTVYFSGGKSVVGSFSTGTNREMLTSQQIPAVLKEAVIAAEDRSYYTEGGVSPTGIVRAAYEDVSGGTFQGGSTITQQFVRQYYATIGTDQTASRKIKEIFVAVKLSHEKSKDWILTNYLNTVYLGNDSYGVGAASMAYFNRPAAKLSVAQSAMLAAMINQPGYFNPDPKAGAPYTALLARWHYVLTNMVRDNAITQAQADKQKFPKILSGPINNGWTGYRGYIMQAVEAELKQHYGYTQQQIDTSGLKIVTTFNQSMMNGLYKAVDANKAQMKAEGTPLPGYAHVGAVLERPGTGAILAMYAGPSYNAKHCARLRCQYNMALQSRNQVGSSFKPYVLAQAVKENMNVQTSVLNGEEPICVPPDSMPMTLSTVSTHCPTSWFGVNIPGENMGPIDAAKAAAQSSDPAFEDLIHRVGTQQTINLAKAFGVNTKDSGLQAKTCEVGIALGTASLTVEEQATTFASLVDGGEYVSPHVIAKITKASGAPVPPRWIEHRQVLSQPQAADVDYALSFDTINGTAYPNGVLDPVRPTIGKTGTTDQAQSAFFIGAVPQYSLAVGMFTNQQNELAGGQTLNGLASVNGQLGGYGGAWPTHIWSTFMQSQFGHLTVDQLPAPDYTGFEKWVQVKPKPQHHQQHCSLRKRFFGQCPGQGGGPGGGPGGGGPGQGGGPSPNPTASASPTQCAVPSPACPSPQPPGQNALRAQQLTQPADRDSGFG
jgi:membrane peptidoglycan carboxypeptidase